MEYGTIEAIQHMDKNKNVVFEAVLNDVSKQFTENLFLCISFNLSGYTYLMCTEEPVKDCIPQIMTFRKEIPMECKWRISEHNKTYVQSLIDKLGQR